MTFARIAETFAEDFGSPPVLAVSKNKDGHTERNRLDVPASRGRSFTLSFDVTFQSVAIYAGIAVQVGAKADGMTKNLMGIDFHRSDDDTDIRTGRGLFIYIRKEGEKYRRTVHETMMRPIELGGTYRVQLHYERESHIRAAVKLAKCRVWDTGPLTIGDNDLSVDELRFHVRPYPESVLACEGGVVRMVVTGPHTGGRTDAVVDNVRIDYFAE